MGFAYRSGALEWPGAVGADGEDGVARDGTADRVLRAARVAGRKRARLADRLDAGAQSHLIALARLVIAGTITRHSRGTARSPDTALPPCRTRWLTLGRRQMRSTKRSRRRAP